ASCPTYAAPTNLAWQNNGTQRGAPGLNLRGNCEPDPGPPMVGNDTKPTEQDVKRHDCLCRCPHAPGHHGTADRGVPGTDRRHAGTVRWPVPGAWWPGRGGGGYLARPPDRHRVPRPRRG